ncbi:hypothetical protein [Aquimarina sp. 2201CG5-10]|uniref:hypothetical protein n=1 Tax=Aquimarina callyspongiae TaxID=3098150 RepID=UPI002AB49C66|nr:hypothetical protein [Aquimarina sp. 2201CG5-10]MDY8135436.1 hypothetical protein [Aquimarina sp. 2201CG5-10]
MDLVRHCDLCDNQKTNLNEGTTCGLTGRKPEFHKTCSKIVLTEKFENKLKTANIEYDKIRKRKNLIYLYFGIFITIGLAFIIYGYLLGKYVLDDRHIIYKPGLFIQEVHITIMAIGLLPFGIAYRILNRYLKKAEIAKSKRDKIDEVLNEYQIEYDINITYGKEFHGTRKTVAELKVNGIC